MRTYLVYLAKFHTIILHPDHPDAGTFAIAIFYSYSILSGISSIGFDK
jgi:hypothetical protein